MAAILAYIYWRTRPEKPDFRTACGIGVKNAGGYSVNELALDKHIRGVLKDFGKTCADVEGVRIKLMPMGFPCEWSHSGRCNGWYAKETDLIWLGWREPVETTALKHEFGHRFRGNGYEHCGGKEGGRPDNPGCDDYVPP